MASLYLRRGPFNLLHVLDHRDSLTKRFRRQCVPVGSAPRPPKAQPASTVVRAGKAQDPIVTTPYFRRSLVPDPPGLAGRPLSLRTPRRINRKAYAKVGGTEIKKLATPTMPYQ